jgi:dihydrofolate reductase
MAKLIYAINASLDGYIEDSSGSFDWSEPHDDVFVFITDLLRPINTHLYGRRMYETMAVWETQPEFAAESDLMADFAHVWQDADKVVYSTTLDTALTERTRIEREFDPAAVRELKASTADDLSIGGPGIAAEAFEAGLVDECHLFIHPVTLGGGKPALPLGYRGSLELLEERRFESGVMHLRYRVRNEHP